MTGKQKESLSDIQKNVHQWMTIIGFPVLVFLVGDMYNDFKKVRNNDIRQDSDIRYLQDRMHNHEQQIESVTSYIYSRPR